MTYVTGTGGPGTGGVRQDVSGAVTSVIVRYVRERAGNDGITRVLALSGVRRPVPELEDPTQWSSYGEVSALIGAAGQVCSDADVARHLGEEILRQHDGTDVANLLRSLGSPKELLRNVAGAVAKFFTISSLEVLEIGGAHAILRAAPIPGHLRDVYQCDFTKGLLSQVPVLFGLVPATVTESECAARGGRFCLYSVGWEEHQWSSFVDERQSLYTIAWGGDVDEAEAELQVDEETKVEQLTKQVAQLTTRLQDVYSTAADLLASDKIDQVLENVTRRAANAVNAPRYILAVQVEENAPYKLHYHGFASGEAETMAAEVLVPEPDTRGGSRLIVDVRSLRHHYGRLAAIYPEGMTFLPQEREALSVYADYAATALDMVTALDETRRSHDTTNALLQFARDLSLLTTIEEVATKLQATVPAVIGCQSSTVFLWDPARDAIVSLEPGSAEDGGEAGEALDAGGSGEVHAGSEGDGRLYQAAIGEDAPPEWSTVQGASHGEAGVGREESLQDERNTDDGVPAVIISPIDSVVLKHAIDTRDLVSCSGGDLADPLCALLAGKGAGSAILVPISTADEFIGIVTVEYESREGDPGTLDHDAREKMVGLANQAATALQNAGRAAAISHMAWHDALTGLPNRRLLEDRADQVIAASQRSGEPLSIFFIDLDHFKQVNDTLGHAAGDDLIQQVADRIRHCVRQQDTVARLGGDEFAVLLPGLSNEETIVALANRIGTVLRKPFDLSGKEVFVSGSIGITTAPRDGQTYDELLTRADVAMYHSKTIGGDTFSIYSAGGEMAAPDEKLQLERDLAHALERSELFILYQPFIDIETTRVVGVEALLRWRHPTRGVLEPISFIEMAEGSELIVPIDTWVLSESCKQLRRWIDVGLPPLRVSVNVCAKDLNSEYFAASVLQAVAQSQIDTSLIELELTERVTFDASGPMAQNVEMLKAAGIGFSVDDFGTGSSGLDRIGTFPVSTLKIDHSFIQVLGPDPQSQTIVEAIARLASDMGMSCVAEGVETATQSRILLQRGCTTAQGFFFSPPLLPTDVENLLRSSPGPEIENPVPTA